MPTARPRPHAMHATAKVVGTFALEGRACLDPKYFLKFHYVKRRFLVTSKCRHMHGVLNVDEIKN
jgi:hypothetical protein